jgi:hypothetical protein
MLSVSAYPRVITLGGFHCNSVLKGLHIAYKLNIDVSKNVGSDHSISEVSKYITSIQ